MTRNRVVRSLVRCVLLVVLIGGQSAGSLAVSAAPPGAAQVGAEPSAVNWTAADFEPSTHRVTAPAAGRPADLDVDGPAILETGEVGDYTASVTTTATVPITYTWELAGRHPIVVSKKAFSDAQSFTFGVEGTAYITVTVENTEGSSTLVRRIYVQGPPEPDLVARDLTYNGSSVTYYIRNYGDTTVTETHTSALYVDGAPEDLDEITVDIAPGVTLKRIFSSVPPCSGHDDEIALYVDRFSDIAESDETNNSRIETVQCDPTPPRITRPPFAYDITTSSALIRWETDEPSDSEVYWGTRRGAFNYRDKIPDLVTSHAFTMTGLLPSTTYEYKVVSTDAAGNSVESRPATFETDALASPPPPTPAITMTKNLRTPGAYEISATFSDASQVAHVEFLIDGNPVGVDYGNRRPPATASQSIAPAGSPAPQATAPPPTVVYKRTFVPMKTGFTRDTFFEQDHTVTAVVQTWDRTTYVVPVTVNLPSTSEPLRVEAHIQAPNPDHTIYINGDTTPAGTQVLVEAFAARFDWDCEYGAYSTSADCEEVMRAIGYVNVYLGSDFLTTLTPTDDQDFDFEQYINLSGLPAGSHQIRVLVVDAEAGDTWLETFVEVVQRLPSLALTREVDRFGNRIRIRLTVENLPEASGPAEIKHVEDYVRGFQVAQGHQSYRVWAAYSPWSGADFGESFITIDFPDSPGDVESLDPGESLQLDYWMVPVLYEDSVDYEIGHRQVEVQYVEPSGDVRTAAFDREWLNEQWLVSDATHDANYLIITSPAKLRLYDGGSFVNELLMTMADLARLKLGVIGYLNPPVAPPDLDALITKGGAWSTRMDPDFETVGNGYVLLVGETEIIPAWNVHGGEIDISDQPYADTGGAGAPDLILGRIIGNWSSDLIKPIQASIDVTLGDADFDRSKAWLITGGGEGQEAMVDHIEEILDKLNDDIGIISHTMAKAPDYHAIGDASHHLDLTDGVAAGDFLGSGYDQAVLADRSVDFYYVLDPKTGTDVWGFYEDFGLDDKITSGNVLPGAEDDIVVGDVSTAQIHIYGTGATTSFSPGTYGFGPDGLLATGDVDGDGLEEILYGATGLLAQLFVHDATGAQKTGYGFSFDFNYTDGLAAGDLGGGPAAEIVIGDGGLGTGGALKVFTPSGDLLASKTMAYYSSYNQIAVGNVAEPAGSKAEIVVKMPGWIYVYSLNTAEATIDEVHRMYLTWMEIEDTMVLADVDGDGVDEILIARASDDTFTQVNLYYCDRFLPNVNAWTPESDILVYRGHGSPGSLGCVESFPNGFGDTRPFTFAPTCNSGDYEEAGDNGVAEAFFDEHGAVYIGSTHPSSRRYNMRAIRGFLGRWGDYDTIGESFFDLERDKWGTDVDWRRWIREYNLYGDVKFGAFPQPGLTVLDEAADPPTETLTLDLPALVVTTTDGIDYVTIPGGDLWLEVGEAQVPIWQATYDYPAGVRVQEIALDDRSALETHTGWLLPMNTDATDYDLPAIAATDAITEDAWVPAPNVPFTWTTMDNPDGTTTLSLAVFPFFYQALTTESEYYRHFGFTITTTTTALTITHLSTLASAYEPGDWVEVDLRIRNDDPALDVVVQGDIVADDGTFVSGLLLRSLHEMSGTVAYEPAWDSTGTSAGDYRVVVSLTDGDGNILDSDEIPFRLGTVQGEAVSLTVDPTVITDGPEFDITLVFSNTGTVPITGTAEVTVRRPGVGEAQAVMTTTLANVQPGSTATFTPTWDATGLPPVGFHVYGLVKYDGRATPVLRADIAPGNPVYLPLVIKP